MNLAKDFQMRIAVNYTAKVLENKKGLFVKSVQVKSTIGLKPNGNGNVLVVDLEQH